MKRKSYKKISKNDISADDKSKKIGISYIIIAVVVLLLSFLYKYLLEMYYTERYDDMLFSVVGSFQYMRLYLLIIGIFVLIYNFLGRKKTFVKKMVLTIISIVLFASTVVANGNAWIVSNESISYRTLFEDNKATYSYRDIQDVTLEINSYVKSISFYPKYTINFKDGNTIELSLREGFYKDDSLLVEFDRLVADKRVIEDTYAIMDGMSDEVNEYYKELFATQK